MYKIVRVIYALILSALIVSPVHAEGTDTVEFEFFREIIGNDTITSSSFDSEIRTNLIMSGLEPNKEYQVDVGSTSVSYTTDNNGTLTISLFGINPGQPQHVTIKGVSQLSYSINHA